MKNMNRFVIAVLALGLMLGSAVTRAAADETDKTPPSYDMKAQSVLDLQQMQKKLTDLAAAIPADKFNWKPAPGVRSIAEVCLHIAGSNYMIMSMLGVTLPADFKKDGFEKSTTDKAKVIDQLNQSFAFALSAVGKMTNADFAKPEKKLGPDANDGDIVYLLVTHAHEHLGQSIAYARMVGVVPPWTAEEQKKNPQQPKE
ncbi:MAG: DinB family protein [Candidatus Acidiferrales bacterium]